MNIVLKMYKALIFDEKFYRELELDRSNLSQAVIVVILVGICSGAGTLNHLSVSLFKEIIFIIIGWLVWSIVLYLIGVKILNHTSDMIELLMYLGFAFSPGLFNILGLLPQISNFIFIITFIWTVLTFIYAAKHALNCDYTRAVLVSVLSVIPYIFIRTLILII